MAKRRASWTTGRSVRGSPGAAVPAVERAGAWHAVILRPGPPDPAGNYYLNVTGIANGTTGGIYNGAISAQVPVVPEPTSYALMIAGLVVIGFLLRRRRS
ncbi:FxDxF family PEP-CTERM protein [Roseateles violae]|uniref:FxDxF family PEP-CTERM protein n=1 Tax=Roseateles violae TaxID=3058042 RepID=A0ABT8DZB5_9BURK|nr:FxDxF family PEP-CTERM protein [Pelomonas sp. PFR6]MDN3922938.1 FxDxF family PEP-CTERM protein [Pelomonas sp. PFR6]